MLIRLEPPCTYIIKNYKTTSILIRIEYPKISSIDMFFFHFRKSKQ